MKAERLTIEEMKELYPDMWVILLQPRYYRSGELAEGIVVAHNPCFTTLLKNTEGKYGEDTLLTHTNGGRIQI